LIVSKSHQSPSRGRAHVSVADDGDLRKYRTELPNIIFLLGLTPYELALYAHLKRTAGPGGACWKSTQTLAGETGMSAGMVSKAKKMLAELSFTKNPDGSISRVMLKEKKGMPTDSEYLFEEPLTSIRNIPNDRGGKPFQHITLTNIWSENMTFFSKANSPYELANSPYELANSPYELASSPGEIKKEPIEERTIEEDTKSHSRAGAAGAKGKVAAKDSRSSHPSIQAVRAALGRYPQKPLYDKIIAFLGDDFDEQRVVECALEYASRGRYLGNIAEWLFDWYANGIPKRNNSHATNGRPQKSGGHDHAEAGGRPASRNERRVNELKRQDADTILGPARASVLD
jgi:hypothetical protein